MLAGHIRGPPEEQYNFVLLRICLKYHASFTRNTMKHIDEACSECKLIHSINSDHLHRI